MTNATTRSVVGVLAVAAVMTLAGCSGGSSAPTARPTNAASPTATPTPTSSPTSTTATTAAPPAITASAARELLARYSVSNNQANHSANLPALSRIDTQTTFAEDRAYTRAGHIDGYNAGRFWSVPQRIAAVGTRSSARQYFFATTLTSAKPPKNGRAQGKTAPDLEVYAHTAHGWQLAESVGLPDGGSALPDYVETTTGVVSPTGFVAGARNPEPLVAAALNDCTAGATSTLVSKPPDCGELDQLRQIGFAIHAHLDGRTWPSYSVALTGGQTLVMAAQEITIRVASRAGIQFQGPSIIAGLLGIRTKGASAIPHGYVEHAAATVALVIPAAGGQAKTVGLETDPLSASRITTHTFTET
jgi:hypothetical protein